MTKNNQVRVLIITPQESNYAHCDVFAQKLAEEITALGAYAEINAPFSKDFSAVAPIGGDGTVVKTVPKASGFGIPTFGTHGGRLGFLAAGVMKDKHLAQKIVSGLYKIEHRMGLRVSYRGRTLGPFANEILLKDANGAMGEFQVSVNGDVLYKNIDADGVMVATATGSTGYSGSAGGPYISTDSKHVCITPLNPQRKTNSPFVAGELAHDGGYITMKFLGSNHGKNTTIYADGRPLECSGGSELEPGEEIKITQHPTTLLYATYGRKAFYNSLRVKKGFGV